MREGLEGNRSCVGDLKVIFLKAFSCQRGGTHSQEGFIRFQSNFWKVFQVKPVDSGSRNPEGGI